MKQVSKRKAVEMARFNNKLVKIIDETKLTIVEVLAVLEMSTTELRRFLLIERGRK